MNNDIDIRNSALTNFSKQLCIQSVMSHKHFWTFIVNYSMHINVKRRDVTFYHIELMMFSYCKPIMKKKRELRTFKSSCMAGQSGHFIELL